MARECYVPREFRDSSLEVIDQANRIIRRYMADGYTLTLRQLYYRFVAEGLLDNTLRNYKRLGSIINDARLAGLIDWEAIEDRTRSLHRLAHWDDPADIIEAAAASYREELWRDQPWRVEVWIEKEALAGVFSRICDELHVPLFPCRGYTSQSEMYAAARRLDAYVTAGQEVLVLHFGDHDPSGIDMTRDVLNRLVEVFDAPVEVERIALNMDQVRAYDPPPNPAKESDSRAGPYIARFGRYSWELDALEPAVLADLVRSHVEDVLDAGRWNAAVAAQERHRRLVQRVADRWDAVMAAVGGAS